MPELKVGGLLTTAGINVGTCLGLYSLYSILRKQPGNVTVYHGRRLAVIRNKRKSGFGIDRLIPSASWIYKAWDTSEDELLAIGGLDAVVFVRVLVFSIQIFSIASAFCLPFVLPVNYFGKEVDNPSLELKVEVFSIENVEQESRWLWTHCAALYIITFSACILLYFNYKGITSMRLAHIHGTPTNPCHFSILVRSIPWSPQASFSDTVRKFFSKYHASGYLAHQMVYRCADVIEPAHDADKVGGDPSQVAIMQCGLCGSLKHSAFKTLTTEQVDSVSGINSTDFSDPSLVAGNELQECASAFVFFKTRVDAVVGSHLLQSSNPMFWVTDMAPEPHDVYWSNLWIPHSQLWLRQIAVVLCAVVFVFAFLIPVAGIQKMTKMSNLKNKSESLDNILKKKLAEEIVTGYLPSVILTVFMITVPPTMNLFSALEGCISHSERKKSACEKVLYFTIWNVFFVNVLSGSIMDMIERPKEIFNKLAEAVPNQGGFFMNYACTSGWTSLAFEIIQIGPLVMNWFNRCVRGYEPKASDCSVSFPYHTELPRVLLFGLIGFTNSVMAPMILPPLVIYFSAAYIVYKNQFVNVYTAKYESGGRFWPIACNATIFSLVVAQVTAIGVFGLRKCPIAAGFIFPLVVGTLLFYEYCRRRFAPIFSSNTAIEVLIEMDLRDEQTGRLKRIYHEIHSAYCQYTLLNQEEDNTSSEGSAHAPRTSHDAGTPKSPPEPDAEKGKDDAWSVTCNVGVNEPPK